MSLRQADIPFVLPYGYIDAAGETHRQGRMRMATALDEIEAIAHPRVQANEAYLPLVLLSRVITQLGTLSPLTPQTLEGLFAVDLAYLEDVYIQLNSYPGRVISTRCPQCSTEFSITLTPSDSDA
jgi:hypothetical protein